MTDTRRFIEVLEELLAQRRTASLATVDEEGMPHASMVPFAVYPARGTILIHISALSPHFVFLQNRPYAGLLVSQTETAGAEVHALPRVSIQGNVSFAFKNDAHYEHIREAYLQRFPEVAFMTELPDFAFAEISPKTGRLIAGFGAARKLDQASIVAAIQQIQLSSTNATINLANSAPS